MSYPIIGKIIPLLRSIGQVSATANTTTWWFMGNGSKPVSYRCALALLDGLAVGDAAQLAHALVAVVAAERRAHVVSARKGAVISEVLSLKYCGQDRS